MSVVPEIEHQLRGAAERVARSPIRRALASVRRWRGRLLARPLLVGLLVVSSATGVALAARALVEVGSPAPREYPNLGERILPTGTRLLSLRIADPAGGPPWGMRLIFTTADHRADGTRGDAAHWGCVQIGRVLDGELGVLGQDGAFHDDGRFHPLAPDVLYGTSEAMIECVLPSQSFSFTDASADRSGDPVPREGVRPPARELRSISFGLLGPDAASVTYRTSSGLRTEPVSSGRGAYLIVEPVAHAGSQFEHGGSDVGSVSQHVLILPPPGLKGSTVSAITYRLGSHTCTSGFGAPVSTRCPMPRPALPVSHKPARNLREPLRLTLVKDTPAVCRRASLNDPCYQVRLQFKAPYAVRNAASEYSIETKASCPNTPVPSWSIDRDVKRGESVKELSTWSFSPSACSATEILQVRYQPNWLAEAWATRRPIVVGTASLRSASR